MSMEQQLERLAQLKQRAALGGGQSRIDRQHAQGKLTARERIALLLDNGSFNELDALAVERGGDDGEALYGDAVVTGWGSVDGRTVYVFAFDFTVFGGSLGAVVADKITKTMDLAVRNGAPLIGLNDSGGARIQEGVGSLGGYGDIFLRNIYASGVVPQISLIMGPCAGGAAYSPALTDFIFMVDGSSQMFITGPDVIASATGETTTADDLGGAMTHAAKSGVAHFAIKGEQTCIEEVRRLLSFLPANNLETPPYVDTGDTVDRRIDDILSVVPEIATMPYDVRDVIERVIDNGDFLEVHAAFAQNIVVGFGRIGGHSVGLVGNQPMYLGGVLDIDASRKAARFVRFCDAFNIPLVTLVDVPGYLPGVSQEWGGIITHGAKLVYAYAEATVPKVTVITRKGYGGAYVAMGSKHLGADVNYAWPAALIAVMDGPSAVRIINRRELNAADDVEATRAKLAADYKERFEHPYIAAAKGYVDDVIDPRDTRIKVARALAMLRNKSQILPARKHGSVPL
ncbi:MAG: acyl-CoA carboxylase subunit beta [Dehalococcoidia bacterium]|nr:acyl-CoA carboxylase subunit beta [Dehalococcoidia bacterium]